jgi:UDP-N-acetylglucosamine kinase
VTRWHPDAEWLDARFRELIEQRAWFATTRPEDRPVLVLLAGQPGAGKTRAHQFVRELHGRDFEAITGDDFRAYHPDFEDLQRNDPTAMPRVTQEVSGPLVARAISYAREHRLSIILEGTFRDSPVVLETARTFQQAGFVVHVVALAVRPQISRLSTLGRFYTTLGTGQNRWTPPQAHDASVAALPHTMDDLAQSPYVDKITIIDRAGAVLAESNTPGDQRATLTVATIIQAHQRALTPEEQVVAINIVATIHNIEQQTGPTPAANEIEAAWIELHGPHPDPTLQIDLDF